MADIVIVEYADLIAPAAAASGSSTAEEDGTMMKTLERAFGHNGYGLIGIRGVPSFSDAKMDCLSQAYPLAHLPAQSLKDLEDPDSFYNAGWSHGKEQLKPNTPDLAKASFYFNPIVDVPGTQEDRAQYPVSYPINKWPRPTDLPQLEPAAKRLGCLMKEVAVHLARHLDAYAHGLCGSDSSRYPPTMLYDALKDTDKVKGRLLYYYALSESEASSKDSWIGFHNDSGYITALAGDIYLDPATGTILDKSPSPNTGLYVEDRNGQVCKVHLPPDCMAIQMGECTQIVTGGAVVATPHCVQGAPNVARVSLACFIDVPPSTPVTAPEGTSTESILARTSTRVPPLSARWENGMTFGDFLTKTFQMYYSGWDASKK